MVSEKIHVQAHRGASSEFLENTLAAFERAIEIGANSIELDIHATKDGEIIVYHDFELSPKYCRTASDEKPLKASRPVFACTLAELREFDCVNEHRLKRKNSLTPEQRRIPTLREVFELFQRSKHPHAKEMGIDIEIKREEGHPQWSPSAQDLTKRVLEVIAECGGKGRSAIRSFDFSVLEEVKRWAPEIPIAALTGDGGVEYLHIVKTLKPKVLAPHFRLLSLEQVERVHQLGVKVMPYTVNQPRDWEAMLEMGVDGMTTDDPRGLIAYLRALEDF